MVLVHAICEMEDGRKWTHAWVEDQAKGSAIFQGFFRGERILAAVDIPEYRREMRVLESKEYTIAEVVAENLRTGHLGPWERKSEVKEITIHFGGVEAL